MAGVRGASRDAGEPLPARPGRRMSRVGLMLMALSAVFFGVNFGHEWLLSRQIEATAAQLQQKIDQTEAQNAQLQSELSYYSSKQYVVPEARAQMGLVHPGDTLMRVEQLPPRVKIVYKRVPAPAAPESIFSRLLRAIFQ